MNHVGERSITPYSRLELTSFFVGEKETRIKDRTDGNGSARTATNVRQYRIYWTII